MHLAVLLPTSQVLVINGGNYLFHGSVNYPLLLTPKFDNVTGAFLDYDKTRMNEAVADRLYHNVALLLPDGRIWTSGGQAARVIFRYTQLSEKPLSPYDPNTGRQPLPNTTNFDFDVQVFDDGWSSKDIQCSLT